MRENCGGVTIYNTQSVSGDPVFCVVAGSHKNCDFFHAALLIDCHFSFPCLYLYYNRLLWTPEL
jgi:hypothetical protein